MMLSAVLAGCAPATSKEQSFLCIPVIEYTKEFQNKAADELEKSTDLEATSQLINDYMMTRDQLRAVCGSEDKNG